MVLLTNQELGLPYEVKVYLRTPVLAPPELKQVHPLGKVSHHKILTQKDLSR
jgi:glutathione S-transferase